MKKRIIEIILLIIALIFTFYLLFSSHKNKVTNNIRTFYMSNYESSILATTKIESKNISDEEKVEKQVVEETESIEEQGNISYNGDTQSSNILLGNYKGLTYYSQLDSRWGSHIFTSRNNNSQTIANSGCGPTSASMIVTAIKGAITPDEMGDLFVENGYRSANSGTYFSAFRWVADTFNIEYQETSNIDYALELLNNNNYIVASCGNGLFTYGGHYIVLTKIDNNVISIYDPYLYAGKFETSTRRGKATVQGTTVYCTVDNFKNYANSTHFFCYKHGNNVVENNSEPIQTASYTRYVKVQTKLNIRNAPNGSIVGSLDNNAEVQVYETNGDWSRINDNQWVSSLYLTELKTENKANSSLLGLYKVTASKLNVRSGAGTNYKIKKVYYKNTRFDTYEIKNNWAKTPSGWVCLDYCKLIKQY